MFNRLGGLETEYLLRFHPRQRDGRRPRNADLFEHLLARLRTKVAVAAAMVMPQTWFLGNGGAVRFERLPFHGLFRTSGFVEGSTPECRGPKEMLRYQRAQDALLSQQAAAGSGPQGDAALLKISHDSQGHVLGCHENYEATIGSGGELLLWRVGMALATPLLFVLMFVMDLIAVLLMALLSLPMRLWCGFTSREPGKPYAVLLAWVFYVCRLPLEWLGAALVQGLAFRRLRAQLLPFLITRTVFSGSGMVCADGQFVLSSRATALRAICGVSSAGGRSVFYFTHVLKGIAFAVFGDARSFACLFHRRQRLQLAIGDSNMAQFAEYLKLGTTLLVLDAIEAGELPALPRIRRPLRALRAISADPSLQATVSLADGTQASALEIQRFYLHACRRFVKRSATAHADAQKILTLWEETLDALETDPMQLVGKLDWVTKRYLLGGVRSVAAQRKLDLRYHELSRDGYYLRLEAAGIAPTMVEPEEVRTAMAFPPEGTPATVRGQLIREFARSSNGVRASWSSVVVPARKGTRVVRL